MLRSLYTWLKRKSVNDEIVTRRRSPRRDGDQCVSVIGGRMYPVKNWSLGGLLIQGNGQLFSLRDEMDVVMKFKLRSDILEIRHRMRVIRKNTDRVAFEFSPLGRDALNRFQSVIDHHLASHFVESQTL